MIRTLKLLGLAVVAACALSAVGASGASAAEFHCDVAPCLLTGSDAEHSDHVFKAGEAEIKCTHATFTGTVTTKTATKISVRPTYSGCTFFGEPATVDTTGCTYEFSSHTNPTGHLPVTIECTPGSSIKVTAPGCTLTFSETTTKEGVKVTNVGSGSTADATIHATVETAFVKGPGGLCFLLPNVGTYSGTATLRGYEDLGGTKTLHEDGYTVTEGKQVGIAWF